MSRKEDNLDWLKTDEDFDQFLDSLKSTAPPSIGASGRVAGSSQQDRHQRLQSNINLSPRFNTDDKNVQPDNIIHPSPQSLVTSERVSLSGSYPDIVAPSHKETLPRKLVGTVRETTSALKYLATHPKALGSLTKSGVINWVKNLNPFHRDKYWYLGAGIGIAEYAFFHSLGIGPEERYLRSALNFALIQGPIFIGALVRMQLDRQTTAKSGYSPEAKQTIITMREQKYNKAAGRLRQVSLGISAVNFYASLTGGTIQDAVESLDLDPSLLSIEYVASQVNNAGKWISEKVSELTKSSPNISPEQQIALTTKEILSDPDFQKATELTFDKTTEKMVPQLLQDYQSSTKNIPNRVLHKVIEKVTEENYNARIDVVYKQNLTFALKHDLSPDDAKQFALIEAEKYLIEQTNQDGIEYKQVLAEVNQALPEAIEQEVKDITTSPEYIEKARVTLHDPRIINKISKIKTGIVMLTTQSTSNTPSTEIIKEFSSQVEVRLLSIADSQFDNGVQNHLRTDLQDIDGAYLNGEKKMLDFLNRLENPDSPEYQALLNESKNKLTTIKVPQVITTPSPEVTVTSLPNAQTTPSAMPTTTPIPSPEATVTPLPKPQATATPFPTTQPTATAIPSPTASPTTIPTAIPTPEVVTSPTTPITPPTTAPQGIIPEQSLPSGPNSVPAAENPATPPSVGETALPPRNIEISPALQSEYTQIIHNSDFLQSTAASVGKHSEVIDTALDKVLQSNGINEATNRTVSVETYNKVRQLVAKDLQTELEKEANFYYQNAAAKIVNNKSGGVNQAINVGQTDFEANLSKVQETIAQKAQEITKKHFLNEEKAAIVGANLPYTDQITDQAIKDLHLDGRVSEEVRQIIRKKVQERMEERVNIAFKLAEDENNSPLTHKSLISQSQEGKDIFLKDLEDKPIDMKGVLQRYFSFEQDDDIRQVIEPEVNQAVKDAVIKAQNNTTKPVVISPQVYKEMFDRALTSEGIIIEDYIHNPITLAKPPENSSGWDQIIAETKDNFRDKFLGENLSATRDRFSRAALGAAEKHAQYDLEIKRNILEALQDNNLTEQITTKKVEIKPGDTVSDIMIDQGYSWNWGPNNAQRMAALIALNYENLTSLWPKFTNSSIISPNDLFPFTLGELYIIMEEAENGDTESLKKLQDALKLIKEGKILTMVTPEDEHKIIAILEKSYNDYFRTDR